MKSTERRVPDIGAQPLIEMIGNRRITVEGSTGILLYEETCIKINTSRLIISFSGRGLRVRSIGGSCVEVEGYVTDIGFTGWENAG